MKIRGREVSVKEIPLKAVNKIVNLVLSPLHKAKSKFYINRWAEKRRIHDKIKVGFIVQMPQLWDKQESVYRRMADDSDFDPYLIIVPAYDFVQEKMGEYGEELAYFKGQCSDGKYIQAWRGGSWEDLIDLGFEYLFYQRPYNRCLPKKYQSNRMIKYSKTCYIPYATAETKHEIIYPESFFSDLYFGFMEDKGSADENNSKYRYKNHRAFYNIGYPVFEKCILLNNECNYLTVLWTPRWNYDPVLGGSHFFEYNDILTNYEWGNRKLIIRPHPLMWSNFQKKGLLSSQETEVIKQQWSEKGIEVDNSPSIENMFETVDILISDRSSVIPMFFMTGKPVIYCPLKSDYGSLFSTVLPGLYVVDNERELLETLNMLLEGKDPLKRTREGIISKEFMQHCNAAEAIVDQIKRESMIME